MTANVPVVGKCVTTSIIQSIHHQNKLSEELHIIVRADWRNNRT